MSTYVEKEDTREIINISKLNAEIDDVVEKENALKNKIKSIIAELEQDE